MPVGVIGPPGPRIELDIGSIKSVLMARFIQREEVARLAGLGAQIVEVLPREEYEQEHLPGAISLPLKELDANAARALDRSRPVVTYCNDFT